MGRSPLSAWPLLKQLRCAGLGTHTFGYVVTTAEVSAGWLADLVQVPTVHTLLPVSRRVGEVILSRLEGTTT